MKSISVECKLIKIVTLTWADTVKLVWISNANVLLDGTPANAMGTNENEALVLECWPSKWYHFFVKCKVRLKG